MNKGIVFDLDGVLLDYSYRFHKTYEDILSDFGFPCLPREELFNLRRRNNMSSKDFLEKFLVPIEIKDRKAIINSIVSKRNNIIESEKYLEYDKFFDGIADLANKIKKKGIKLGIITRRKNKELVLNQLKKISDLFDFIEVANNKEIALKEFVKKFELTECYFLSDTSNDIAEANKAQVKSIGVLTGLEEKDVIKLSNPYLIIDNAQEILKLI